VYSGLTGNTAVFDNVTVVRRLAFDGSAFTGVARNAVIRLTNTETRWCGSAAVPTAFANDNGSYVPFYGIGLFADYRNGFFPETAGVFQNRLVLGGFASNPLQVCVSRVSSSDKEAYQYFQVTDDLSAPDTDPFDIIINSTGNDTIQAIVEWQQALYLFSRDSVYRIYSEGVINNLNKNVVLISNLGACNPRCIAVTESTMLFVSTVGVFDIAPILQNEYRVAEVSVSIRNRVEIAREDEDLPWAAYDSENFRVFVGIPGDDTNTCSSLYVYETRQQAWTEYASAYSFKTFQGVEYSDISLGRQFAVTSKLPCFDTITRFNYDEYSDYVETSTTLLNATPVFWSNPTYSGVFEYTPDVRYVPITNVRDIRVFTGAALDTLTELVFETDWVKTNTGRIRLLANPGAGFIVVVPLVPGSYFGAEVRIDNIKQTLSDTTFGTVDFSNACLCSFGVGYGGVDVRPCEFSVIPDAVGTVGYPYLALYVGPALSQEVVTQFKRITHITVNLDAEREYYTIDDVGVGQSPAAIVNQPKFDYQCSIGVLYQADYKAPVVSNIFSRLDVREDQDSYVYKEALSGLGYSYRAVIWSYDSNTWSLCGYQFTGQPVGMRHSSGSGGA
jgi:hypothetical protein